MDGTNETELQIEVETGNGGTITVTIGDEDFILDATRSAPPPLVERAADYLGSGFNAAMSHPVDVQVAWWYRAARAGTFDVWSSRPRENAQGLALIYNDNMIAMRRASDRRIAIQMLLLYYETDLRSKLLVQLAARQIGGTILSLYVYSFGGRLAPNFYAKAAIGAHNFYMSMSGAATRACIAISENRRQGDLTGHIFGPHFIINALLTGDDTFFDLAQVMGPQTYHRLIAYLREHPEAIQIDDTEYALINRVVIWLEEFFADPERASNNIPEGEIPISP